MRIVQLIDSLHPGGAERMAVNLANVLASEITFSGIVATRKEGVLKNEIESNVHYLFLNRNSKIDFKAIFLFLKFIRKNKVEVIHAHGSSYFFGMMLKILVPKIQLIWHDHYGNREQDNKQLNILKFCSVFFTQIFTVNESLKTWSIAHLYCKKVSFLPNFADLKEGNAITKLNGNSGKRIVCLANLKHPKNHKTLVEAFVQSAIYKEDWTLHFIGKDFNDAYSDEIKAYLKLHAVEDFVTIYNSCSDIYAILQQATIGVLSSTYEGFPVTLLEYAQAKLTVVSTNVGYCKEIISHNTNGLLFSPLDTVALKNHFQFLIKNPEICTSFANQFQKDIDAKFSKKTVINHYLNHIR